jgi:DNA ligase-4
MPFRFAYVCDLLQQLDDNQRARAGQRSSSNIIDHWFLSHRGLLVRDDFNASPLLSTLLPEKRTDRVYSIQSRGLQRVIGRCLGLGLSRRKELERWQEPGSGVDLGDCVEQILTSTVSHVGQGATHSLLCTDISVAQCLERRPDS